MASVPLPFRTNESKYSYSGSPRLINAYAEQRGPDAKGPLVILPCPGLTLFASPSSSPCRGTIALPDLNCAYSIHSTSAYKITYDGTTATTTRVGTVPGTDVVQLSRNQATSPQITIRSTHGVFYIENDVVLTVTDSDLPADALSQDHAGGYTVYGFEDRRFFLSSLNDCSTVSSADYATAERSPDPLVRVFSDQGDLFIFKKENTEHWRNTGQADFPFEPMPGTLQKGLLAANAVARCDNTPMWPGHDRCVYRLAGSAPVRISTHGIERTIEDDASPENIIGFSHEGEGHSFYTLTGSTWTRSFDAATQLWHSRESFGIPYWRARFPFRLWGKTIVGDVLTGNLYELDKDAFVEGTNPIIWGVDTPTLHVFPNGGVIDAMHLDMATGVGLLPLTAQGSAPKVMLSWSTDGGYTFKGDRVISLGSYGDRVRVTTRRLGRFGPKGVQFRIRISDPVIRSLVGIDVEVRPLKR
jgi:hypothetical protein